MPISPSHDKHTQWLNQIHEDALDPERPICDAHHHLWLDAGHTGSPYTLADFHADTDSGHKIVNTVFLQCHAEYRKEGPEHLRPVGETEFVARMAQESSNSGQAKIAAIMAYADVASDTLEETLQAHENAGRGLFRGVRYMTAQDTHPPLAMPASAAMDSPQYLAGIRKLGTLGYTYDAMVYHPQLHELAAVARACPDTTIVINHLGGFLGTGPYKDNREGALDTWRTGIKALAALDNTYLKLGGIGMPMMGFRWDKQQRPPTSEELAQPWAEPINDAIAQFGPQRCMFESNFPVDKRGVSYTVLWNAFKRITKRYSATEKNNLFHDSAARAYRF